MIFYHFYTNHSNLLTLASKLSKLNILFEWSVAFLAINKEKNEAKALAEKITTALSDKKAHDIDVIDMEKVSILSDYFVICSGTSTTHIKSLADEVDFVLSKDNIEPLHREGMSTARWILLDYGSVIVHIFHEEERQYYSLERLWSDGKITRKA